MPPIMPPINGAITWRIASTVLASLLFSILAWIGRSTINKVDTTEAKLDVINQRMEAQAIEITALRQQVADLREQSDADLGRLDEKLGDMTRLVGGIPSEVSRQDQERIKALIKSALEGARPPSP